MILALKTLKSAPDSLLHTRFFSLSAYKFGPDMNVKVSAAPCTRQPVAKVDRKDPNFLRAEMKAELAKDEACFALMVQPQVPGKNMPIEDPTVEWSERDSPFVTVATITVRKQEFDTERQNDVLREPVVLAVARHRRTPADRRLEPAPQGGVSGGRAIPAQQNHGNEQRPEPRPTGTEGLVPGPERRFVRELGMETCL